MAVVKGPGKLKTLCDAKTRAGNVGEHPLLAYTGKRLGDVRGLGVKKCKYCDLLKPLRTHHCSICRTCVLKMDHHCRSLGP